MQQLFTAQFMEENSGCYKENVGKLARCSFMADPTNITLEKIVKSEIPLKDKYWFVCKKIATKAQNQQIAITVAEIVLPIYEKRYPENKAPREALEVAKQFIAGHIGLEQLQAKRAAAYAAAGAAYAADGAAYAADGAAAYAAAGAAYAAYASAAAAYAAYAADAAADAAAAYAAAYAAAGDKKQLEDYLLTFVESL
jgi:hypothetical protein